MCGAKRRRELSLAIRTADQVTDSTDRCSVTPYSPSISPITCNYSGNKAGSKRPIDAAVECDRRTGRRKRDGHYDVGEVGVLEFLRIFQ